MLLKIPNQSLKRTAAAYLSPLEAIESYMPQSAEDLIEKFCLNTVSATSLLYKSGLYGQMLVIIYSSIDLMGLLDAPPTQASASGDSFKK